MSENKKSFKINCFVIGTVIGLVTIFVFLVIFSAFVSAFGISSEAIPPLATVALTMGSISSGIFAGLKSSKNLLLAGALSGALQFLISFLIALAINGAGITLITLFHFICALAGGCSGSIIAVSIKERNKKIIK